MTPDLVISVALPAHSVEVVRVAAVCSTDPTGGAAPRFTAVTAGAPSPDPAAGAWVAGTWETWDAAASTAIAAAPSMPGAGAALELAPGTYDLWVDLLPGGVAERPRRRTHLITVTP